MDEVLSESQETRSQTVGSIFQEPACAERNIVEVFLTEAHQIFFDSDLQTDQVQ
jgi:hypothetical protein